MFKKYFFARLAAGVALILLCACSDSESTWNSLSFSVADRCKHDLLYKELADGTSDDVQEYDGVDIYASPVTEMDTVYFKMNPDGSASASFSFATRCGMDFTLKAHMSGDTLFVNDEYASDIYPDCSCVAEVNTTIPAKFTSAKILVPGGSLFYTRAIAYRE